jgi:DNA-binding transcriptional LysR family regulator
MNYTLVQLKMFVTIAQTQSITRAAEELHLTQPAISVQLKNFQDQFDLALTEIIGRQLYLTEFGKEVAVAAQRVLDEVNKIDFLTAAHKGQLSGTLKISSVSIGNYVMPYFLSGFMESNPGVELLLDVTDKKDVIESLEKNEVDFALVSVLPEKLTLEKMELIDNKLVLVGNAQTTFGKKPSPKSLLEKLPLIYRERGSGSRLLMEEFLSKSNLKVKKKMELTTNESVKQAVIAGLGYAIVPLISLKNELRFHDLQIIPVKGLPIQTNWYLVWLKGKKFSPIAQAYLNYLQKNKTQIVKDSFSWHEQWT